MGPVTGKVYVVGDRYTLPLFRGIGAVTREAYSAGEALDILREAVMAGAALVVVFKHILGEREEEFRREADKYGITVLVLPTRWAPAEPVNIEKLIAKALGLG